MIYDCIYFFNEIDILKLRLEEIGNIVDKFIIIEGSHTFSQQPKISFFNKYKDTFKKYNDKILHFIVDLSHLLTKTTNRWDYEYYQRNYVTIILKQLEVNNEDIILISDVDEIPYYKILKESINIINNNNNIINNNIILFHMIEYRYYFNYKLTDKEREFIGTFMIKYNTLKNIKNIQLDIRNKYCCHRSYNSVTKNKNNNIIFLKQAGLHLSSFGGTHCLIYKLQNYSHSEHDDQTKSRITNNPIISSSHIFENNEKWRIKNNFYNWYNFNNIDNIDYKNFKNYKLNNNLFDIIKNNRMDYTNFFLFEKGI